MMTDLPHSDLRALFTELIEGRTVKRSRHELLWGTHDVTVDFLETLKEHGYKPTTVAGVGAEPGERVPAFVLDGRTAYFGWVFWEKFSEHRLRKLFGSVVRNTKGDWAVQIGPQLGTIIYANESLKTEMDIENPSGI